MKNGKSFDDLIHQINTTAGNIQRDRGTLFERLVLAYLKNEPTYKHLYTDVWMLSDVPEEYGISSKDTGVDLVARDKQGQLTAVQAKFYKGVVGKAQINSYIAELGKQSYSKGLIVSTGEDWGANAQSTIDQQSKEVQVIGLSDLRNSQIDWTQFNFEHVDEIKLKTKKNIRGYQREAIERSVDYFKDHNRGQLIMAPGTGKTFTSLKLIEQLAKNAKKDQYRVLYMVPSIQLLTQTLRGWNNDVSDNLTMTSMAVTSDRNASRASNEDNQDVKPEDIGFPATTSYSQLLTNYQKIQQSELSDILVVFSTYQSIDVINQAQKNGFPEFDITIADEAHKTTGAKALGDEYSPFTKVHNEDVIHSKLRLYQTATPKIYGPEAKANAVEQSIVVSSMDDKAIYGDVIYRLGFGDAVSHDILTDYKLMVLAVDESVIEKDMQSVIADPENGLNIDDVGRIIGVWNAMMKRHGYPRPNTFDGAPMKRAIAFTSVIDSSKTKRQNVVGSKQFAGDFEYVINEYLGDDSEEHKEVKVRHADGSMNALQKNEVLSWLADENMPEDEARIVSNVKFLTEGIDVPTLDGVIFLAPKRSQVDIVQAIGRIMRKAPEKDYGYIILPIVVPSNVDPESVLDNNKKYEVIWQVMNALRSVDERFEATINKLQLNKKKPKNIGVIGVGGKPKKSNGIGSATATDDENNGADEISEPANVQMELDMQWDTMREAIYGKIVKKVGDRRYLEDWSADVERIALRYIDWLNLKLEDKQSKISVEFQKFIRSLRHNINSSIDQQQAVEMLAQHLITKPVFEALFDEYSFVNNNPVSSAMENIIIELQKAGFTKEQKDLEPFYESVRIRAEGIDNAAAKQKIIVTLYNKFFSKAFKSTTDRLGIVFTPIEVVDFIVKSVDDVLKKYFGKSLASENVHILDPFVGTGTFIVRTLTYLKEKMDAGEITLADITRKFTQELHANEIILLSYYIAAINIEATFDDINGDEQGYVPFEGIVLTDTFESTENEDTLDDAYFGNNNKRLKKQQEASITVIIGNPPYSVGAADNNNATQNISYSKLDNAIRNSYAKNSSTNNLNTLYDSYIRAIRWASDRLPERGIIGFVSNGGFIDSKSADGLRKSLYDEFNHLYIFNLRGDQRTQGETSRKEGGKIFGSGSRTPIAISILVKDSSDAHEVHYRDIGDYLSREDKLKILRDSKSIVGIDWKKITPDKNNDWINQRDESYEEYANLEEDIITYRSIGITSSMDHWAYGFSKDNVVKNIKLLQKTYNSDVEKLQYENNEDTILAQRTTDETRISWTTPLKKKLVKHQLISVDEKNLVIAYVRPFTKKWLFYDGQVVESMRKYYELDMEKRFRYIATPGGGIKKDFSVLAGNLLPDKQLLGNAKIFVTVSTKAGVNQTSIDTLQNSDINFSSNAEQKFGLNGKNLEFYIYGLLHSKEYRDKYKNDLEKGNIRIPSVMHAAQFVNVGQKLMDLHLNYENQPNLYEVSVEFKTDNPSYKVLKMKHPKKGVLDTIIYNKYITIKNIPEKAYDYVVNGKAAIEWIIDQYRVTTDKKSGIVDDPNEFSDDPKYILNLLLSVITVSMKTLDLIDQLPKFEIIANEEK